MLKASVNGLTTMDSTYSNVSAVKHQVYLKNRALMYTIGILLIGPILGFGYLFYLEGSAAFAIGFVMLIGIAMYGDRKSTRLNSSHVKISYAVFCLKKKKIIIIV